MIGHPPSFEATYFDGRSACAHPVLLHIAEGHLYWVSDNHNGRMPLDTLRWDSAVGQTHALVHLPDGGMFRVKDRSLAAHWPQNSGVKFERWIGLLEGRMRYAVAALVLAAGLTYSGLRWGVPMAATQVAHIIPVSMEQQLGTQTLTVLEHLMSPSQLPPSRQSALTAQVQAWCTTIACPTYQIHFRQGTRIGANAMALPGGTIVVTDELVKLAKHDEEILAVVAHELGHVQERHGLRMALQSLGAGAVLVALTGDLSRVSDLAASLPSLLLQSGYSRRMEREADDHAWRWLNQTCISPERFADILRRLDPNASETGLLDSHPGTTERIHQFSRPAAC